MSDEDVVQGLDGGTPKRKVSRQDKEILNNIVLWGQILESVLSTVDFGAALAVYHYDPPRILQIQALQRGARDAYTARDKGIDDEDQAILVLKTAVKAALAAHKNYALILRPIFKDGATREALRLSGTLPKDLQLLIAGLDAAYQTNLDNAAYLTVTSSVGYDASRLNGLLAGVANLSHLKALQEQAQAGAIAATQIRNEQYGVLRDEMRRFLAVAKVASQGNPAWSNLLNRG